MRTPWSEVTIIAAYADPGAVPSLMMTPALAHGTRPGRVSIGAFGPRGTLPFAGGSRPVSEVIRTVMLPFPASGWRTKEKGALTASPPGPTGGMVMQPWPVRAGPPLVLWHELLLAPAANSPSPTITSTATTVPMTQPRTVLNLVHSARRSGAKPSRLVCWSGWYGVTVPAVIGPAPQCRPGQPQRRGTRPRPG